MKLFKLFFLVMVIVPQILWAQSGYLFTQGGMLGGMPQISDTGAISAALGLSYWFWAIVLSAINIAILWWSLRYAFRR